MRFLLGQLHRTAAARRSVGPGVSVAVEAGADAAYVLTSPHQDIAAWEAMVFDALGTRSASTAQTFLYQLTELPARPLTFQLRRLRVSILATSLTTDLAQLRRIDGADHRVCGQSGQPSG